MKISVVMTTARYGGFDVLCDAFGNQTMSKEDFEVIVIDELYKFRFAPLTKPYVHLPRFRPKEYYDNTAGFNEALSVARGELVCFFIDYMWCQPDYLQRHWDFYQDNPGWTLSGYTNRYPL